MYKVDVYSTAKAGFVAYAKTAADKDKIPTEKGLAPFKKANPQQLDLDEPVIGFSAELVAEAKKKVEEQGYAIISVDAKLVTE